MANYPNINELKQIPITDFLSRLGHFPTKRSGKEIFFLSMLRKENTPSFCVNDNLGLWFDHGGPNTSGIKGGSIIDLALAYWYPTSLPDILLKISAVMNLPKQTAKPMEMACQHSPTLSTKNHYRIRRTKDLGKNPVLTKYLQKRQIWIQAQGKLKEIYYSIDNNLKQRQYYAIGWKNDLGAWELRNAIGNRGFKACLGKKSLTTILGDPNSISIFEGYLDYLSWLRLYPHSKDTVIVLNSVNLIAQAIEKAKDFKHVTAYLDRDKAGEIAFQALKQEIKDVVDGSSEYQGFKDFNAYLIHFCQQESTVRISKQPKIVSMSKR